MGHHIKTYQSWANMRNRCNNKNNPGYKYYGARGIKVCERWNKYENFLADMGQKPDLLTIDRIDNNGNYEPSNCRWTTIIEQANNKRSNHPKEFKGWLKKRCLITLDVDPIFRRRISEIAFDRNISRNELLRRWIKKCMAEERK